MKRRPEDIIGEWGIRDVTPPSAAERDKLAAEIELNPLAGTPQTRRIRRFRPEADRYLAVHAERATRVPMALRDNSPAPELHAHGGGNRAHGHAGTGDQRLQQHIGGAGQAPIPAGTQRAATRLHKSCFINELCREISYVRDPCFVSRRTFSLADAQISHRCLGTEERCAAISHGSRCCPHDRAPAAFWTGEH